MKRTISLLTLLFLFSIPSAFATHIMGGEIGWNCDTSGGYIFDVKLYRDCSGNPILPRGSLKIHNYPNVGAITTVPLIPDTSYEITPECRGGTMFSCANGDPEATFFYHLKSAAVQLTGTPPAQGWIITFDDNARNATANLTQNTGITLRSKMFNYPGRPNTCYDRSPEFLAEPISIHPTGLAFQYNPNASDPDFDSLYYDWAYPLDEVGTSLFVTGTSPATVPFVNGYTFQSPFPGVAQNSQNVPATLNSFTGNMTLTPYTQGKYVSVLKVSTYNCGNLTAEIYRDYQFQFFPSSSTNSAPNIRPPFADASGAFTRWEDTVYVGSVVNFNILASDFPAGGTMVFDSVYLYAYGAQFGDNYTNASTGCPLPPCATLNLPLPRGNSLGQNSTFNWQTSTAHIVQPDSCQALDQTYTFVFRAIDDACPIPAQSMGTVSITLLDSSLLGGTTGLKSEKEPLDFEIYPNPSNGIFNVIGLNKNDNYSIQIRNIRGQLVKNSNIQNSSMFQIELNQKAGVYFIQLVNNRGESFNLKIIKQ